MEPAPALLRDAADSLWRHGYARLPGLLPPRLHRPLARRLLQLRQAGVPAVGIFRDGATWQAAAQVMPVAIHFLGHRCAMLPNLWAMALLPGRLGSHGGARGWPPHVDYPGLSALDGKVPYAISLSFWLALSDTGPDNACMHVRPQIGMRGAEPVHGAAIALPARAGDVHRHDRHTRSGGQIGGTTAKRLTPTVRATATFRVDQEAPAVIDEFGGEVGALAAGR